MGEPGARAIPMFGVGTMAGEIREQIDTIFRRDPAARSVLEIALCYPGFHAILLHRAAHKLYTRGWYTMARVVSQLSRQVTGINITPAQPSAGDFSSIMAWAL